MSTTNNYLSKKLFKNVYFILSLVLSVIFLFGIIFVDKYHILSLLRGSTKTYIFAIVTFFVYAVILFVYFIANLKNKNYGFYDTLAFTLAIFSLLTGIYSATFKTKMTIKFSCFFICAFLIGMLFVILRIKLFGLKSKDKTIENKNFFTYVYSVSKKYSFFIITALSLFTLVLFYVAFNKSLSNFLLSFTLYKKFFFVLWGLCVISALYYLVSSILKTAVSTLDAILVAGIISVPLAVNYTIIMFGFSSKRFIISVVMLALFIVLLLFRYFTCDIFKSSQKKQINGNYLKKVLTNYSPSLITLIATLSTAFGIFFYVTGGIKVFKNPLSLTKYFSWAFVSLSLLLTIVVGFVISVINIKNKNIAIGDFFTITQTLFSVLAITVFAFKINLFSILAVAVTLVLTTLVLIFRIKYTKQK